MWLRTMLHNEIPCNSIPNPAIPCHLKVDMEEYTHWSPSWSYEHHQKSGLKHHYYQEGFLSGWLFHKRKPHGQRVEICWECFLRQGSDQLRWCPNEGHTYCDLVIIFWRKDNMFNWEGSRKEVYCLPWALCTTSLKPCSIPTFQQHYYLKRLNILSKLTGKLSRDEYDAFFVSRWCPYLGICQLSW